jgi:hypothetical protein
VVLEGPSLAIRVAGQAERRMPLGRVSRILANERTRFDTPALLACAERGIAVLFVAAEGRVRGRLLGEPGERQELHQRFLDLLDRPDWKDLYGTWLMAQRRRAALRVQRRLQEATAFVSTRATADWVAYQARHYAGARDAVRSARWLEEQLYAWMVAHLQNLGFGAQTELGLDGRPDLAEDLTGVLEWYGHAPRLGWLARRHRWARRTGRRPDPVTRRDMVQLYHRHGARLARFGRELTNHLHRWLADL